MEFIVTILILISALSNLSYNYFLKKSINEGADPASLHWLSTIASVTLTFLFFICLIKIYRINYLGIFLAAICGIILAIYLFILSRSYSLGDFSQVYPLTKITPLFTLLIGIFYLKESVTKEAVIGIILIIFGVYFIHLKNFKIKSIIKPIILDGKLFALAISTALASALYGLFMKLGTYEINPLLFMYLSLIFMIFFYFPFLLLKNKTIIFQIKNFGGSIIKIGFLDLLGYITLIFALSLSKLSYVFALRQIGILLSVFIGVYFLKEKYRKIRILSSIIILIGIILVSIF